MPVRCGMRCATWCCSGSNRACSIFRVDNPHTKPFRFWEWLIHEIQLRHPDVIFLAEAFTRPKLMKGLAKLGFTQSYTYFTWRTQKWELEQYLNELTAYPERDFFRPNFFVNTPGHPALSPARRRALDVQIPRRPCRHAVRAPTASTTGSNCWNTSRFPAARNISIRKNTRSRCATGTSPATSSPTSAISTAPAAKTRRCSRPANLRFIPVDDGNVIGFVKESVNQTNSVVVAIALSRDVHEFWLPLGDIEVGMPGDRRHVAALENLITGERYPVEWGGIRLRIDPVRDPALLFRCLA